MKYFSFVIIVPLIALLTYCGLPFGKSTSDDNQDSSGVLPSGWTGEGDYNSSEWEIRDP